MDNSQATRSTLLVRLNDGQDSRAWPEFVEIYSPIIFEFARRYGLQDADAADLMQEVLRFVSRSICNFRYDRERGPFRGWLRAVARSRLHDFWAARKQNVPGSGDTRVLDQLEQVPSEEDAEAVWEQEYRKSIFEWATEQIRDRFEDSTWQAFWQASVEGQSTKEVALALGMTEGAVYIAKCRVLARLRQKVQEIEE